jgi:hypothetical protein
VEELLSRLGEFEEIVGELERKNALQRLSWSADYRVTLSHFRLSGDALDGSRDASGAPVQVTERNAEQWTHRARLMLQADPIRQLRFRARLVAFKRFGDSVNGPAIDGSTARVPRDASARLDRFWVDWFITDKLSVSLGRLSTTDGSPSELRENLDRPASSVSIGLVDSEYDIAALTYAIGPALLRGFYVSRQFQRPDDPLGQLPFLASQEQPTRIFGGGLQVRSETRGIPTFELSGFYNPRFRPVPPYVLPLASGALVPA